MRPATRIALLATLAIAVAHLGDQYAWLHLGKPGVYDNDFGRMLRIVGYLPLWILMAVAVWLHTSDRRTALLIGGMPALGGLAAEVAKILLRRERPKLHDGAYYFRPFNDHFWSTRDIGLPSSHAFVAFSGAWILCRLYPKGWPVWVGLAAGCALTRVQAEAHFLSDVTVAAVLAYGMVAWCWARWGAPPVSS
ncbi:MAG: phosphatase PAP2 family protein [Gemmatimonadetes bacterium]|jgi:membrane-associated phospholipid phosphatase|nr:phosphatase PAP2 family protein [Gemmatimonadota bacterium]MBK9549837.1 phosphatase PAP2 family protein [Gemmatimonadota bacterium]